MDDKEYHELNHHEDNVVNHRLTWLLTGQPLLFLAYVNAAVAIASKNQNVCNCTSCVTEPTKVPHQLTAMLYGIPVLGGVMSACILVGVVGAAYAMNELKKQRGKDFAGIANWSTLMGMLPPMVIPLMLVLVWAFVLYYSWGQ